MLGIASLTAGCGDPQEVIESGTTGTNAQIGDLLLRNLQIDEPSGPSYSPGADPRVFLTIVNEGSRPDVLTRITSPAARSVEIRRDEDCDGTAEVLPRLALPAQVDRTSPPNAPGPTRARYFLRLVDLVDTVPAGASVPLTFTFTGAGTTTVQAKVDLYGAGADADPSLECTLIPSP
ncbi:MAG TPA: copper chaperone PCu(A)C [Mycobacteriales bacterium]